MTAGSAAYGRVFPSTPNMFDSLEVQVLYST